MGEITPAEREAVVVWLRERWGVLVRFCPDSEFVTRTYRYHTRRGFTFSEDPPEGSPDG